MERTCLKCRKGPVRIWRNQYTNYFDLKCRACGFVWHELAVGEVKAKKTSVSGRLKKAKGRRTRARKRQKSIRKR